MGQYWILANIDARQTYPEVNGKLGEFFWVSKTDFAKLLVRVSPTDVKPFDIWPRGIAALDKELSCTSKLLHLPNELMRSIFDKVDDVRSCVCLSITRRLLGMVGEARLRELLVSKLGGWAGHRIICFGDYCDEFPASVKDEVSSQLKAYVATSRGKETDPNEEAEDSADAPSFYDYAGKNYAGVQIPASLSDAWDSVSFEPRGYSLLRRELVLRLRKADHMRLEAITAAISRSDMYVNVDAEDLVLCNLSKGEYVRNGAAIDFASKVQAASKFGAEVDLGLVLFSRICWSTDDSCAMGRSISPRLAAGTWAGDRFEIVPQKRMGSGIEWKDVTEEALAWVREVHEADIGPLKL